MRAVIAFVLVAGCYAPQLSPCEVHCGRDSPCPADLTCGGDHFCHAADDNQSCARLVITTSGNGGGQVTSSPTGVDCSSDDPNTGCDPAFANGTTITLSASAAGSGHFDGWSGDACDGSSSTTCTLQLDGWMTVDARFF